jgi:hypothetical protein
MPSKKSMAEEYMLAYGDVMDSHDKAIDDLRVEHRRAPSPERGPSLSDNEVQQRYNMLVQGNPQALIQMAERAAIKRGDRATPDVVFGLARQMIKDMEKNP